MISKNLFPLIITASNMCMRSFIPAFKHSIITSKKNRFDILSYNDNKSYFSSYNNDNKISESEIEQQQQGEGDKKKDSIYDIIRKDIQSHSVILYMKGTPQEPLCGFSQKIVLILQNEGAEFTSRNVLEDEKLRQGIKDYAEWPTIPQLYINSKFIGGCDITTDLYVNGELTTLLEEAGAIRDTSKREDGREM